LAYFTTRCPTGTSLAVLVGVEGRRWAIEGAFEAAKNELGLDHNATRSWPGWHLHHPIKSGGRLTLVMLAFALLTVIRHRAEYHPDTPKKRGSRAVSPIVRWSVQEIRRLAGRLAQRRIEPAFVVAWSVWRRCHQARAQQAHLKRAPQLEC
jgi:SRSO17 transposase